MWKSEGISGVQGVERKSALSKENKGGKMGAYPPFPFNENVFFHLFLAKKRIKKKS